MSWNVQYKAPAQPQITPNLQDITDYMAYNFGEFQKDNSWYHPMSALITSGNTDISPSGIHGAAA